MVLAARVARVTRYAMTALIITTYILAAITVLARRMTCYRICCLTTLVSRNVRRVAVNNTIAALTATNKVSGGVAERLCRVPAVTATRCVASTSLSLLLAISSRQMTCVTGAIYIGVNTVFRLVGRVSTRLRHRKQPASILP